MVMSVISQDELVDLFLCKATEPPPEANLILAKHLQSKESCDLASAVAEAMRQYAGRDRFLLPTPAELLPPLA